MLTRKHCSLLLLPTSLPPPPFLLLLLLTQTYDMNPLDGGECERYSLPDKETSWCGALVDIPSSAAVVDFVISDK